MRSVKRGRNNMRKIKRDDLMVSDSKVYQKEYTGGDCGGVPHFNWSCIACFHHLKDSIDPCSMAEIFYNSIAES